MSNFSEPDNNKLSFVFKTKENLNRVEAQRRSKAMQSMRNKWVAAAIIALASGSSVLLSQNTASAATTDNTANGVNV